MSLEVLSGANYNNEAAKLVQNQRTGAAIAQEQGNTANINITEIPATTKSAYQSQYEKEQQKEGAVSEQQIKDAISKANNKMRSHRTRCEFSYHEETKRVSIKILDRDTQEVIKEIPPEETLEMVERMWDLAGLLIDERR